ncbi:MAG: hypothetical protein A2Y03_07700 [Omnitrophica WOR_2 bacterium GWF2_38_59]|nr:MAG: hypothetical protein A2Y06_01705 [Omnitrophica WOR_2 bacterium GWA2_37_7]OGX26788.1 MAG: hypothetical protein A2Y03_07700 [Omnitrophica WOR_2 bacterium GWF2_38_59]OGX49452.1 MAG: hypothetical protein A2243_09575 [Omnitrophica WOR_2 bacterium RIFOXYA2_FULL_38_17]OGX54779.1 MAG: hypothetical protein A2267_06630 [Omnitrophica WOR_2 bacterium RIFOXYA12_FULL_38_10]OGX58556.1 MAG: hypothetical protein A2306_10540 [Omnitrophica WOR_2 bacterium RIFOXYB2_FULL_38_16]HBG62466.1 hypothetical prote
MRSLKFFLVVALLLGFVSTSQALQGVLATSEDVARLKVDVLEGKIKVGSTRLKEISRNYGEAASITDTDKRLTYEYTNIKIDFDKFKYLRNWELDSFKKPAYNQNIDDLRAALSKGEIVGDYVTLLSIMKDYGAPTEYIETDRDGELSIYYYGNIKLTFENVIVVNQWRGKNLTPTGKLEKGSSSEAGLVSGASEKTESSTIK